MAKRIVLVGCGKTKAEGRRAAQDLYVGNLFRAARAHAEALVAGGTADLWLIVSGKYGVLDPLEEVSPYDEKAPGASVRMQEWGEKVVYQLGGRFPGVDLELTLLAGVTYVAPVESVSKGLRLPWTVLAPLCGLEVGERLSWFKARRVELEAAALPPAKAEKLRAREAAAARSRAARHSSTLHKTDEDLERFASVDCPVCPAKAGATSCLRPIGTSRWELLDHGELHTDRILAAPDLALTLACSQCQAVAGQPCRNYKGQRKPVCRERRDAASNESVKRAEGRDQRPTKDMDCPTCHARAGRPCKRSSGHKAMALHAARVPGFASPPALRPDCSTCRITWAQKPCAAWDPAWGTAKCDHPYDEPTPASPLPLPSPGVHPTQLQLF